VEGVAGGCRGIGGVDVVQGGEMGGRVRI
jgi:hypothetical protein